MGRPPIVLSRLRNYYRCRLNDWFLGRFSFLTLRGPAFVAGVASVLASHDANAPNQEFHPIIRRLLDEFGDRDDVLKHIEQNMHSFGWMGSLTTYFALYQAPLESLENHPKGPVRRWAKKMLTSIELQISAARDDDDEQQAHWNV
jgi:hypothetical protein